MAIKKLASKYAVVELNNIAGVRTGEIVSQYELDAPQIENGMLVVANHVKEKVELPKAETDLVHLHASVEKLYNGEGRNEFVVKKGSFLPRCYKLVHGDTFETNAVIYDDATYANMEAIIAGITETTGFGVPDATGYIKLVQDNPVGAKLAIKAVKVVTLPNGETGIKFRVINGVA